MDAAPESACRPYILVVEDDANSRLFLKEFLQAHGYQVREASGGEEAIHRVHEESFDLVLTDIRLGALDGLSVLREALARRNGPEVVLATAYGSIESAVDAIKQGAFDYLSKPFDTQRMLITLQRALERRKMRREIVHLKAEVDKKYGQRAVIARSPQMRRILDLIETVAMTDSAVLIEGESGTGKELVARAIHAGGPRAGHPFIAVNCSALPEALLESELFGHARGAFTGALHEKKGLFEEADGGTILLDEIADMPLMVQPKLLRALEEGEIRRVGSNVTRRVDVRVIAATNRDLQALIGQGRFREDLFFRLNVIPIVMPPLRERPEDVLPLANHFLQKVCRRMKKEIQGFSPEAAEYLARHELRGNVRELANLVERAVTLCTSAWIGPAELGGPEAPEAPAGGDRVPEETGVSLEAVVHRLQNEREEVEREHIRATLRSSGWNQSRAARALGISRTTLWSKIKRYKLTPAR